MNLQSQVIAMQRTAVNAERPHLPLTVDYVADSCRRYPGETVTFYVRVSVWHPVSNLDIKITLAEEMELTDVFYPPDYRSSLDHSNVSSLIESDTGITHLIWQVHGELEPNTQWEYRIQAQIAHRERGKSDDSVFLESQATVTAITVGEEKPVSVQESVSIAVSTQGRYLFHLPSLYQSDDLMARFLMLFESFWSPIEGQIDAIPFYFDPKMTPSDFLPWLAYWFNMVLDEDLPDEQRRELIASAVSLYRKRGTKEGLQEYLEACTGGQVTIVEHRASDFRLGSDARLGPGIALGIGSQPFTFTVTLRLPSTLSPDGESGRQKIQDLIEAEKPAHTDYILRIIDLNQPAE